MTTFVRVPEFVPQKSFTGDSNNKNEINYQLSSPLSSYVPIHSTGKKVVLTHTQYYLEHLETSKQRLRSDMDALRQEFEQKRREVHCTFQQEIEATNKKLEATNRKLEATNGKFEQLEAEREVNKNLLLNWETKSRLAQALNDCYIFKNQIIPQDVYNSLKVEGCNYLPYLLSVCAVYYEEEVATCLKIGCKEKDKYEAKVANLIKKGLENKVNSIWYSIPEFDRDLMIKLWLTRPDIRMSMADPIPTAEEGMNAIRADSQISEAERCFINDFISNAVDKAQNHLFAK